MISRRFPREESRKFGRQYSGLNMDESLNVTAGFQVSQSYLYKLTGKHIDLNTLGHLGSISEREAMKYLRDKGYLIDIDGDRKRRKDIKLVLALLRRDEKTLEESKPSGYLPLD